jgi:type IV secretory pathway TraG/TraD family ATPase VirD4
MRAAQVPVTAASLMEHMKPDQLEQTARSLPEEQADVVQEYLDSLGERQRRELSGVRDRLSILAESDVAPWLDPQTDAGTIDLKAAIESRAVVYFSLQSDRRPLLARMLASAIVTDLVTLSVELQEDPIPTLVLIDEFSAIAPEQVARLFGRARSAGISLLLATQEFADLEAAGQRPLRDQALGNLDSTIAYRQNVPASAELVANIAGTTPAWITTQQTTSRFFMHGGLSGRGTRRRGHEYTIHPTQIKQLRTGEAVVITLATGAPPTIAQIHHPNVAHEAWSLKRSDRTRTALRARSV